MKNDLDRQLTELLSEDPAAIIERERTAFDHLAGARGKSLVLFGAGGQGKRTLSCLRSLGIEPLAFVDNNSAAWGKAVDGLQVLSPDEAVRRFGTFAVFIVTIWRDIGGHPVEEIRAQLTDYGDVCVISVGFLYWKYPEIFLPYFYCDLPHKTLKQRKQVIQGMQLWCDEASRQEYLAQIGLRLRLDFQGLPLKVNWPAYLPEGLFTLNSNEVFVDCGAFDGDTLRDYIQKQNDRFKRYIAFEPDQVNFLKLNEYRNSLPETIKPKVTIANSAIGNHNGMVLFAAAGTAQSAISTTDGVQVPISTLDELLNETAPTYIKMDIEGAEVEALLGARECIRINRPILAICVYHCFDHLWRLPQLIHSLSENYHFFLRPHRDAGWDLVCYAVPVERMNSNAVK